MVTKYLKLEDVLVYKLALELSDLGWQIYEPMSWQNKKNIGDQFIRLRFNTPQLVAGNINEANPPKL